MDHPVDLAASVIQKGATETVKQNFSWAWIKEKVDLSQTQLVQVATYFGIGFFSGFLFKKYSRYFIISSILVVLLLKYFEHIGVITFHWEKAQTLLAVHDTNFLEQLFNICVNFVKTNVMVSVSLAIGFLIGYKVG